MNPLVRPEPGRASVDDKNATVQDIGEALVAVMERTQHFERSGSEADGKALLGVLVRYRKVLDKFEKHAISEVRRVTPKRVVKDARPASLPPKPESLRSLQQGH